MSKLEAGWLIVGGSRAGTAGVHHQVHPAEEAEAEGWEQQRNWKGSRRRRLLEQEEEEEELEVAPPEAEAEHEGGPVVAATGERESKLCYEKRQMVWKGMTGIEAAGLTWCSSGM